jgi:hypothetical protein
MRDLETQTESSMVGKPDAKISDFTRAKSGEAEPQLHLRRTSSINVITY